MAKKRSSSGRNPARKPSGRSQEPKGGPAKKKAGRKKAPRGAPPQEEAPLPKPAKEKRGRGRSSARERPAPGRKGADRPSRETAELREFFKPEGMSLGLKFVLTISIMVFLIMVIFSTVIYFVAVSAIQSEMEDNGALMLKAVDSIGDAYLEEVQVRRKIFEMGMTEEQKNALTPEMEAQWKNLLRTLQKRYSRYLDTLLVHSSTDGSRTRATKLLNAMIDVEERGMTLDPGGGSELFKGPILRYIWIDIRTPIKINRGYFRLKGESRKLAMVMFEKELSRGGGSAILIMSAEQVAKTRTNLLINVVLSTLISILIGVGVSFILASLVSKPVNRLIEDITVVSRGKLDHKTVPTSRDEIGVLARTFDAMTQNLKVAQDHEIENQARAHDLKIATEIQAGLLPSKIPAIKGYDLDAYYRPSKEVGGDYYDFFQIDKTHMGVVVADVSGKGIPGSMVMTMARSLLRMEASRNLSTADTLMKVNKVVARDIRRGMFVTALYLILDVPNRKILVSSAGHNPLVVFRAATKKLDQVNPNGIALGFDKGPIFDRTIREEEIDLGHGDRVVLYTDGVVEAMNDKHEEYSDERFFELCEKMGERNSNQFINIVVQDLAKHQGKADQHDDITISTFRVA